MGKLKALGFSPEHTEKTSASKPKAAPPSPNEPAKFKPVSADIYSDAPPSFNFDAPPAASSQGDSLKIGDTVELKEGIENQGDRAVIRTDPFCGCVSFEFTTGPRKGDKSLLEVTDLIKIPKRRRLNLRSPALKRFSRASRLRAGAI